MCKCCDKPFLNYKKQLFRLKEKYDIILINEEEIKLLSTMSYYELMNTYKEIIHEFKKQNALLVHFLIF